jgi:hypothetical protein
MDEKQIEKIRSVLSKGKWNYVLKHGLLLWGIPMAIIMNLFFIFISGFGFSWNTAIFTAIISLIGGFLFGLWNWKILNKKVNSQ